MELQSLGSVRCGVSRETPIQPSWNSVFAGKQKETKESNCAADQGTPFFSCLLCEVETPVREILLYGNVI